MVGTVEQEFRTAGNGTELADYQPLVADRVMVKHIVLLEKQRVGHFAPQAMEQNLPIISRSWLIG